MQLAILTIIAQGETAAGGTTSFRTLEIQIFGIVFAWAAIMCAIKARSVEQVFDRFKPIFAAIIIAGGAAVWIVEGLGFGVDVAHAAIGFGRSLLTGLPGGA